MNLYFPDKNAHMFPLSLQEKRKGNMSAGRCCNNARMKRFRQKCENVKLKDGVSPLLRCRCAKSLVNYGGKRHLSGSCLTSDREGGEVCPAQALLRIIIFFGNLLDIWSLSAIISLTIYNYPANQNSPVPREQNNTLFAR